MKQHIVKGLLVFCVSLSIMLVSGCSKLNSGDEDSVKDSSTVFSESIAESEAESNSESDSEDLDEETMDFIKYNIYVEMNNYMIRVLDNINSYYTVVEDSSEFALIPDSGYTYKYDISPLDSSIVDDAVTVASMEPTFEVLDDLAQKIAEPMKILMDTFSEIYSCYDFADNQYARAKELHVPIQENVAAFEELAYAFMDEISNISDERVSASEQKMLDEGQLIAYNASHMITVANRILDECYKQGIDDANITELDLTNIRPLYEELTETVAAFHEATSDSDQLMKESLSSSTPLYGLPDSLVQSVEWMIKQVESQVPIQDPGREYLGGIIHIEQELSECIDQYNAVFAE